MKLSTVIMGIALLLIFVVPFLIIRLTNKNKGNSENNDNTTEEK